MDADGHVRHSRFVGLREDKVARDVARGLKIVSRFEVPCLKTMVRQTNNGSPNRGNKDEENAISPLSRSGMAQPEH